MDTFYDQGECGHYSSDNQHSLQRGNAVRNSNTIKSPSDSVYKLRWLSDPKCVLTSNT